MTIAHTKSIKYLILLFIFLCFLTDCSNDSDFFEQIVPAGNEYIDPVDPAKDDSDQIITDYDQFPDSVKQRIEQLLPGGTVDDVVHWGPFRYIVYKSFPDGRSNKIYIYLTCRVRQVLYMDGAHMERPGIFFVTGTEQTINLSEVPENILTNVQKQSGSSKLIKAWMAESDIGLTYVIELVGFQADDTTAFAYRPDGVLKTMSEASIMRTGIPRKWTESEIEELLGKYRNKYSVESVIKRIQSIPYNPQKGFRFIVLGDSRINQPVWEAICKSMSRKKSTFVIDTGDLVNEGEPEQYDEYLFRVLKRYGKFNFVPVLGNHDISLDGLVVSYLISFGPNSLNYYFDYGNCRFIILDNCSRFTDFDKQLKITDQCLSDTPDGFYKFVFAHLPPGNIEKWSYHAMDVEISHKFTELMNKHQVDHVFVGHIHAYSTAHFQGVDYTVTGGGGAELHKQYGPNGSVHHYVIVDVTSEGIKQQVVQFHKVERQ
ncbi:MAG TPA: metallophosphoesterase [bacterium]